MLQLLYVWHGRGKTGAPHQGSAGKGKMPLLCGIQQQQGWPFGHLRWIQEDWRRLRAKLFLIYSLLPFSPSPSSPSLLPIPFSLHSPCQQPKNQLRCNPTPAVFIICLQITLPPLRKTLCYHPCARTRTYGPTGISAVLKSHMEHHQSSGLSRADGKCPADLMPIKKNICSWCQWAAFFFSFLSFSYHFCALSSEELLCCIKEIIGAFHLYFPPPPPPHPPRILLLPSKPQGGLLGFLFYFKAIDL